MGLNKFNKVVLTVVLVLVLCLSQIILIMAGDIPESLMQGNQKCILIGTINKISSNTITISPKTSLMGAIYLEPFNVNKFTKYYGTTDKPMVGDPVVLVIKANNQPDTTWLFKATSADYKKLKLVSEKYNMVKRYEEYINQGKYQEAQNKLFIASATDITPKDVLKETGARIYKNAKSCETCLQYKDKLYTIGIGFGGLGVVDAVTSDFNKDGKKEIVFSYSWGSGLHRSNLVYFDTAKKKISSIQLDSLENTVIQEDLIFNKIFDTEIEVYTAEIQTINGDFTNLIKKKKELLGKIIIQKKPNLVLVNHN